jgi:PKD repeat protein
MISPEEKNIFLQDLEEEIQKDNINTETKIDNNKNSNTEKNNKPTGVSGTAIFAAIFVFFIFIIILLVFILGLSGSGNPIFQAFGIEAFEIKTFLKSIINNTFMVVVILLLLLVAVGIFRGYTLPKTETLKKRSSFIFGGVAGGLIFLSIIAWGGTSAFITAFITESTIKLNIDILGFDKNEKIIAPIDIEFSAEKILDQLKRQGFIIKGIRWSKNKGKTLSSSSLNSSYTFQFFTKGIQNIYMEVEFLSGEIKKYERIFMIDDATFAVSPQTVIQENKVIFDASMLFKGNATYFWDFNNDGIFDKEGRGSSISHKFEKTGSHIINLRIESDSDAIEKYNRKIIVHSDNKKSITSVINVNKELEGKTPYFITFDGSDSFTEKGEIEKYTWQIGKNGEKKQGVIISHTFNKKGVYPISLTVTSDKGVTSTEEIFVTIKEGNSPPVAMIKTKPQLNEESRKIEGFLPLEVYFNGKSSTDPDENISKYEWTFINEEEAEEKFYGEDTSKIFRKEGLHKVILKVTDTEGISSEYEISIVVKEPPVVPIIKSFPESGTSPLIVEFNASESTCKLANCKILSYEWDFDNGEKPIQAGAFISHQFTKPGTYNVKLTAITNLGERASTLSYISVTEQPFVACFRASRTSGKAPLTVSFDPNICSKGQIIKYQWDFGDGFVSQKRNPSHTYTSSGKYTVILNTLNKEGRVSEMKKEIIVNKK